MIIVGLTGGVGTGKSTVAGFFTELGAHVVDFDELAREVTRPHSRAWEKIVEFFGRDVLNEDLTINRQRLADMVFCDHDKLARLNEIVHPGVFEQDERITAEIRERDSDALVIKDIPLFYEVPRRISVDSVIVVSVGEQTQLRRLAAKGMSLEDASRRIKAQLPIDYKSRRADFVIDNDGSLEETRRQVRAVYSLLRKRV